MRFRDYILDFVIIGGVSALICLMFTWVGWWTPVLLGGLSVIFWVIDYYKGVRKCG